MTTIEDFDYIFKIVLIGDSGVGKSCLLQRYARNEFTLESKPTIGVSFLTRVIQLQTPGEGPTYVKSQLWDTAGQERFRCITSAYYRGALGVVVCYDITRRKSFENVRLWLTEMRANCEPHVLMLIGTKVDLQYLREVSTEEGMELARKEGMMFMETSAQTNQNVEDSFDEVATKIYHCIHKEDLEGGEDKVIIKPTTEIIPDQQPIKQKKTGCACQK